MAPQEQLRRTRSGTAGFLWGRQPRGSPGQHAPEPENSTRTSYLLHTAPVAPPLAPRRKATMVLYAAYGVAHQNVRSQGYPGLVPASVQGGSAHVET
jgi:hypothetical protein